MAAQRIDGKALAQQVLAECGAEVARMVTRGVVPGLAVVLVGDNPASRAYIRNKVRACADVGVRSIVHEFGADTSQAQVIEQVRRLNDDPAIHGILVQLPLPKTLDEAAILAEVVAHKDVDGFHEVNRGALFSGQPRFPPCTPAGMMRMLDSIGVSLTGKHAVVVGRSNTVGKPMALLLLARDATVTLCTSKTVDLASHTRRADVLVVAVGRPGLVNGDMVKPGAIVLDVGINRTAEGKLVGDVDFDSVAQVAAHVTPVPGGVGPMTVAMLVVNTIAAAQ
ncbi:MAG: bifunctional methylenetetrahydrofolate dehydrogenase/methenyltetrahydrofolate cyclohydrolase FolD [Proteobacteria bacterium]|nr:bifunctional methylenetetrahydrofolate dehydrogenase/methenyltetrahydrofolate cyclohydrolase FolD [Burkholderiales bacterium]